MARRIASPKLIDRTNRLRLAIAKKPVFVRIGPGVSLGYRRNETAGTWVVRVADGDGGNWQKSIGVADDFDDADGVTVLTFWQAQDRARAVAKLGRSGGEDRQPLTVQTAIEDYERDLARRGGDVHNARRIRLHTSDALRKKLVGELTKRDLQNWVDVLRLKMAPASVNRCANAMRAALNLAADGDDAITNRAAWEIGLKAIPNSTESRNVVLSVAEIQKIVAAAVGISVEFGLLVEVAAVTGARYSQITKIKIRDLFADQLAVPVSKKGRGAKKITHRYVPISSDLAARLNQQLHAGRRGGDQQLLIKPDGGPWKKSEQTRPFAEAAKNAGLDPEVATLNALRHSSITRQLIAGVPIRVVAANHDTSVLMIERTYSALIDQHADAVARAALLDLANAGNVVKFRKSTK